MKLRVFLVEDSPVVRDALIPAMEELAPMTIVGFAVGEEEACLWLASNAPNVDVVVIDIHLASGSGLGVLRGVASLGSFIKIVLSDFATPDIRRACVQIGAHSVFDKSQEFESFLAYCRALPDPVGSIERAGVTGR